MREQAAMKHKREQQDNYVAAITLDQIEIIKKYKETKMGVFKAA